jgi:phosphoribosylaminoimidazolecarboxamide formyltransferase / IMP cyclohydrolase
MNALLSVSDKTGIVELAQALHAQGIKLLSTGGTAKLLAEKGLPVTEVAEMTGFPEMLDGRVKTLHPRVHGGLLARRDFPAHMAALAEHQIDTIDVLVVNLYPFEATVAKPGCTLEDAIENIDIGGPAMVRSAAKNWKDVAVLTDASQYATVIAELKAQGKVSDKTKFALSVAAFNRISQYDGAISDFLSSVQLGDAAPAGDAAPKLDLFPGQSNGRFIKVQDLRYGENPTSKPLCTATSPRAGLAGYGQATARQRAELQQHCRRRCRVGVRQELSAGCGPARLASSSNTPTPAVWPWACTGWRLTAKPSKPTPPRPLAASLP